MPNPYETPKAEFEAQTATLAVSHPPRDWMIWLATIFILLLCVLSGITGLVLVLAWAGVQLYGPFDELAGSPLLEPFGAGGLSLTAVALAFGYGQLKAVFSYDLIWTRTVVAALLMAAGALVIGAVSLAGRVPLAALLLPATGTLLLGLCMGQWHRRLRIWRLASPRPIVPLRKNRDSQA